MLKADLTIVQVPAPPDRWCQGHMRNVPKDAKYHDAPIRFFHIVGDNIDMVICEPCLVIASAIKDKKKKGL